MMPKIFYLEAIHVSKKSPTVVTPWGFDFLPPTSVEGTRAYSTRRCQLSQSLSRPPAPVFLLTPASPTRHNIFVASGGFRP
ncbi:hypothetical protein AXA88_24020 [Salmonella enterica]|nr:hypothetical protein [Salmonella enterica]EGW6282464.1 hypothetical protein [Salmonella enterica]EGX3934947.1 hypothetical protein [Salmonella enterica]